MKRYYVLKGILCLVLACVLIGGGLGGYRYYKAEKQEKNAETQFWELMEQWEKLEGNKQSDMYLTGETMISSTMESENEFTEEVNHWYDGYVDYIAEYSLSDELLIEFLKTDRINGEAKEKLMERNLYFLSSNRTQMDINKYIPILESEQISDSIKMYLIDLIEGNHKKEQEQLIPYKLELIQNADDLEECIQRIQFLCLLNASSDAENKNIFREVEKLTKTWLAEPEKHADYQLVAAVLMQMSFGAEDELEDFSQEEKNQMGDILKQEYIRQLEEGESNDIGTILHCILALDKKENLDWLMEVANRFQEDPSLASWDQYYSIQQIVLPYREFYFQDMKNNPNIETISRMIRILNFTTVLNMGGEADSVSMVIYMKNMLKNYPDQEHLPILAEGKVTNEPVGWQASRDIDGDGLIDMETFVAWDRADRAAYKIEFGNGDILDYSFPAEVWTTYRMKYADINADGNKEVILYIDMDTATTYEYSADFSEIADGSAETYWTLFEQAPKGFVIFEKRGDTKTYTPVQGEDGIMITNVFDENGRLDCEKELAEELGEF